ncbi:serine protease snake-like [Eurosta solidaginis]|uniref:serine protease snake-like n=1 Tax=Eurosta solidaginis TaxID=178769 RepID=UPI00353113E5
MTRRRDHSPLKRFLIFLLLQSNREVVWGQNEAFIEIKKCTEVKRQIFEDVKTFSAFIHGAEEQSFVIDNCKPHAPLIVGGTPASPKEFSHIARLGHREETGPTEWFCGGTLISEKYILTAAHCLSSNRGEVNVVRLGELDFASDSDNARPEDIPVRRYIGHKNYHNGAIYNDIGLIELNRAISFDAYKHPACLPATSGDEFEKLLAIGWGSIRFADTDSKKLLKVTLQHFDFTRCQRLTESADIEQLPRGVQNRLQICAGSNEAKDTCGGDSGGPLLAYHPEYPCMYTIVGITSFGIGCGIPNQPGIYTRVYGFIDWIRKIVWEENTY